MFKNGEEYLCSTRISPNIVKDNLFKDTFIVQGENPSSFIVRVLNLTSTQIQTLIKIMILRYTIGR